MTEAKSAQPQLPPLEITEADREQTKLLRLPEDLQPDSLHDITAWWVKMLNWMGSARVARERQLLSALAENESLKAQIEERNNRGTGYLYVPKVQYDALKAERDQALEVIREFYGRTGIIDNGKCAVCRHGHRSWKLPACRVPSGSCSNEDCLSRKADALISKEKA